MDQEKKASRTVAELVAYLQSLPQDYVVMQNSGYYDYTWFPIEDLNFAEVNHDEGRVYLKNTGA